MAEELPGRGFFGWLGRQIGHVKRAVRSDPAREVIYRREGSDEAPHPQRPDVKLRRTVIDEVILEKNKPEQH